MCLPNDGHKSGLNMSHAYYVCIVTWDTVKRSYKQNQRDALISEIYFWNKTLRVSHRFSVHHQESSTVYTAVGTVYVIQVMLTAF